MKTYSSFEELPVWQEAQELSAIIIKHLNKKEMFKYNRPLKDQVMRSALSISSNIAEGFEYNNNKAYIRYLYYAKGSAGELRNQILLLKRMELLEIEIGSAWTERLKRLSGQIAGFINYLKSLKEKKSDVKKKVKINE